MIISEERKNELCKKYFEQIPSREHGVTIRLYKVVDHIIDRKFGNIPDKDEYYALADIEFLNALDGYDGKRSFGAFLYTVLHNKICSLMTKNNGATRSNGEIRERVNKKGRIVRQRVGVADLPLDMPLGDDGMTIADTVAGRGDIMDQFLGEGCKKYLRSLPDKQREIVFMLIEGNQPKDIQKKLGISPKVYSSALQVAKSYVYTRSLIKETHISNGKRGAYMSETAQTSKQIVITVSSYIDSLHSGDWCLEFSGQRLPGQWSHSQKGALIETILHGYQIPSLVVCEQKMENGVAVNWVIDGMQRTSVLDDYLSEGFAISRKIERPIIPYQIRKKDKNGNLILKNGIPVFENAEFDIRGKKFRALPDELQKKIKDYSLHFEMYLGCTAEDVEYHERRYNGGKPMNQNQKGQTYLGQKYAYAVNEVLRKPFFKNNYKMSEYVNASVNRLVDEAVMAINYRNEWRRTCVDNCKFLRDNAKEEMFYEIGDLSDRLDSILSDETRKEVTRTSESFIYFTVFKEFTKLGLDDSRFEEFMLAFISGMKEISVDGTTYYDLASRGTKDKSVVIGKVNHICRLMNEFLEKGTVEGLSEKTELSSYVSAYKALNVLPSDISWEEAERIAVKVAEALMDDNDSLPSDKFDDALAYTETYRDGWLSTVDETELSNPKYLPAIIATYKYVFDGGFDGAKWFKEIAENGIELTGNPSTDYWILVSSFKASEEKRTA